MTPRNSATVAGYFSSEQNAEAVLRDLHGAGFTGKQICVGCHEEPVISVKTPEPGFWRRTQTLFGGGANPEPMRTGNAQPISTGRVAGPESTGHLGIGDFHKTLTGLSLPEDTSRYFSERYDCEKEGVLVAVNAGSRSGEAETILKNHDADMGADIEKEMESEKQRKAS